MHSLSDRLRNLIDATDIKNIDSFNVNVINKLLQINLKTDVENIVVCYKSSEELLHDLLALKDYINEKQNDIIESIQSDINDIDIKKNQKIKHFKKNKLFTIIATLVFLMLNFITLSIPFVFICLTAIICVLGVDAIILNNLKQMNYMHNLYFEKERLDVMKKMEINNSINLSRTIDRSISKVSGKLKYDSLNVGKVVSLPMSFEEFKTEEVTKRLKLTL